VVLNLRIPKNAEYILSAQLVASSSAQLHREKLAAQEGDISCIAYTDHVTANDIR
jgi:hypothetical protein